MCVVCVNQLRTMIAGLSWELSTRNCVKCPQRTYKQSSPRELVFSKTIYTSFDIYLVIMFEIISYIIASFLKFCIQKVLNCSYPKKCKHGPNCVKYLRRNIYGKYIDPLSFEQAIQQYGT